MTTTFSHTASREDMQVFPASIAQQHLWSLDLLEPDRAIYNVPIAISLKGLLDISALEWRLNGIVQRHAVLRTTFTMMEGRLVQVIAPTLSVSLPVVDLRDFPKTDYTMNPMTHGEETEI